MLEIEGIGNIAGNTYEEIQVEWIITDFFSTIENIEFDYSSSTFSAFQNNMCTFQLSLRPESKFKPGYIVLYIKKNTCDYSVEYNLGLRKLDGIVEQFATGVLQRHDYWSGANYVLKLSELQERKSELVPLNVLTIACILKRGTPFSFKSTALDDSKANELIKLDTLSKNFKDLLTDKESCDTTLCVKDKEYNAHKMVLITRSPVFAAMFKHDTKEKQTGMITIPDCDPESFAEFLEYLYSGKLKVSSFLRALQLYETSNKYDVQEIKTFCMEYLKENLTVANVCDIVILADKYDDTELFSGAQEFFSKNLNEVFQVSEWECLLKNNYRLANKLLKGVPKVKIVEEE